MDSLNLICLTGYLERSPTIRWNDNGQAVVNVTLRLEEQGQGGAIYKTFVPLEGYGKVAEQLGTYNTGDLLSVEGKVKWCSRQLANGEKKSSLAVLVRSVHVLISALEGETYA